MKRKKKKPQKSLREANRRIRERVQARRAKAREANKALLEGTLNLSEVVKVVQKTTVTPEEKFTQTKGGSTSKIMKSPSQTTPGSGVKVTEIKKHLDLGVPSLAAGGLPLQETTGRVHEVKGGSDDPKPKAGSSHDPEGSSRPSKRGKRRKLQPETEDEEEEDKDGDDSDDKEPMDEDEQDDDDDEEKKNNNQGWIE